MLKDLAGRLPYGVKIMFSHNGFRWDWEQTLDDIQKCDDGEYAVNGWGIHGIKPYLRPISSMTEEERMEFEFLGWRVDELDFNNPWTPNGEIEYVLKGINWLNVHHFDYRGLIEKGLAIAVTEENNPYKE